MTTRGRAGLVVAIVVFTAAVGVLVVYNRGQEITLGVGPLAWRGEAIHAVFAAAIVGLLTMFLVGLPADLAARRERRRLEARVRDLARERERKRVGRDADDEDERHTTYTPPVVGGSGETEEGERP